MFEDLISAKSEEELEQFFLYLSEIDQWLEATRRRHN